MTVRIRVVSIEGLWTPEELATFLGIPEKTLRDWRFKGYGPSWIKMGKHVRYSPDVVRDWLTYLTETTGAA
ncbi:helix-turn-helix domain-containing protein [Amycolatopsis sp. EV170708-02-1]|uniref:helix-turn-helix domain-containing protein n=1 Tax=Amycolatopsis sp. EV170708-02-1 TaxID=2919322 RepID=UPI001F0BF63B|nr:helix-turn-helix domain-containing protein [Amycolatopsis sp. EV170708-02-1]UMP04143.1 helix-turn-helix domain-containing protein [Amycolatopsis sp. EV170708-02-1]